MVMVMVMVVVMVRVRVLVMIRGGIMVCAGGLFKVLGLGELIRFGASHP